MAMETTKEMMSEYLVKVQQIQRITLGYDLYITISANIICNEANINLAVHKFDEPHDNITDSFNSDISEWKDKKANDAVVKKFKKFISKYADV